MAYPSGTAVGRMAHYYAPTSEPVDEERPTAQEQIMDGADGAPLMAWIAAINLESGSVDLVFARTGPQLGEWGAARGVDYAPTRTPGCWTWPPRV